MTLAEQLGHEAGDRLIILNADDFGMCRSANLGIQSLLAAGAISSATVMMPCGWAPQAVQIARAHPSFDIGVHLTFTSEWPAYRWSPVSAAQDVSSLVDADGYFPATIAPVEERATQEHVRREIHSQIERALALGLRPTHADNHMGSLYGIVTGRDFLAVTLAECAAYGLPFRLPRYPDGLSEEPAELAALAETTSRQAAVADRLGVVIPDYLWTRPFHLGPDETYESLKAEWIDLLTSVRPGVTELYMHPFVESDELRDLSPDWRKRVLELRLFHDPDVAAALADAGVRRIGWRDLQVLQHDLAEADR